MVTFKCKAPLASLGAKLNVTLCATLAARFQATVGNEYCPLHPDQPSVVQITLFPKLRIDSSRCCCDTFQQRVDVLVNNKTWKLF